jgi:hypothetical protein
MQSIVHAAMQHGTTSISEASDAKHDPQCGTESLNIRLFFYGKTIQTRKVDGPPGHAMVADGFSRTLAIDCVNG